MPLVYVSGPIKDNDDFERDFDRAERDLRDLGFTPVNPVTIDHPPNATVEDFMRGDIRALLDCESIYLLKGWEKSSGAKLEFLVATSCGMKVLYE
jgi:hypothetical protein